MPRGALLYQKLKNLWRNNCQRLCGGQTCLYKCTQAHTDICAAKCFSYCKADWPNWIYHTKLVQWISVNIQRWGFVEKLQVMELFVTIVNSKCTYILMNQRICCSSLKPLQKHTGVRFNSNILLVFTSQDWLGMYRLQLIL